MLERYQVDKMTRIIMKGCNGRMGKVISELVRNDENAEIVAGIDFKETTDNGYPVFTSFLSCNVTADVIIDFSSPVNIGEMLKYAQEKEVPMVLSTTGLSEEDIALVKEASKKVAILRSANMSLGVNTIMKVLKAVTNVLVDADFDIEIVEKHHNQKVDAPSGTALALADAINEVLNQEYSYNYDRSPVREKRNKKEIGIAAVRGGTIVGEHEVIYAGIDEVIEIKHTAYSKAIFAKGAIQAAKFLAGKGPGMYEMKDVIG
jgi:4-hydroxy-tetrahydrodipicolinate reductase